jgi:hypothetical protein
LNRAIDDEVWERNYPYLAGANGDVNDNGIQGEANGDVNDNGIQGEEDDVVLRSPIGAFQQMQINTNNDPSVFPNGDLNNDGTLGEDDGL